ncbi:hypothetical protein ACWGBY_06600 [Streptomyces griseus]|uniref:Uncharacterized protein n=1 Tax=Streptomyces sp. CMC78 TaxID=3231512 RepID=A0AB33KDJ0_9ACTN|nr:hypothetical protein [Streptomyces sp. ID01-9D]MDX5574965.1 hypothetical protein [Streptomyces sp. ID01-9D]WSV24340.1 hypothetical protein OG554_29975 [Streptomyces fimicarius]WTC86742.1 hypothetical protein OH733_08280 [Streptomyces griseus]WTD70638.1 hypothetical protein OH763_28705 [Streptomyces griseus]
MSLIPPLLGGALFLAGLAPATDHRGAARWVVEVLLNPAYAEPGLLRRYARRGVEHPQMDFYRDALRQRQLVRVWGGLVSALGLLVLTVSTVFLVLG